LFCGEFNHEGHGRECNLSLTLRENHEEDIILGLINDLHALLGRDKGNKTRWEYLGYPVQFPTQSNNNTARPRIICNMTFP
jgi:hypothetical protein